MQVGKWK